MHTARKQSHGHTENIKDKNHYLCSTSKRKMLKKWVSIKEIIWIVWLKGLFNNTSKNRQQQLLWELRFYFHQLQLRFIPLSKKGRKILDKIETEASTSIAMFLLFIIYSKIMACSTSYLSLRTVAPVHPKAHSQKDNSGSDASWGLSDQNPNYQQSPSSAAVIINLLWQAPRQVVSQYLQEKVS